MNIEFSTVRLHENLKFGDFDCGNLAFLNLFSSGKIARIIKSF